MPEPERRLLDQDPEQRRPDRRPARAEGAGAVAPGLHRLVERHGAGRLPGHRSSTCAPPSASIRRAGPSSTTCGCPNTAGASCSRRSEEDRKVNFGDAQGRAGLAGGAGRVPRHAAPADRHPGRHRAGLGRAAAPPRQDRAVALRHAQPVPGQRRGRPPPLGDGLPAAEVFRPRRPRGGRGAAAPPLRRRRQRRACSAPSTRRRPTGCRSSCSPSSPTATARCSSRAWRSRASIRCRAPAASC